MPLTDEERRAKNRRNAQKSTGPKTEEGKAAARLNALKHGMRAESFTLPGEDPEELKRLTDDWLDYYEPSSPGQRALIDRCVQATIQQRRCARFHHEKVAERARKAEADFDNAQRDELERLKKLLEADPAAALIALKRTATGCRWLAEQWEHLRAQFDEFGFWVPHERDQAIRLSGARPEPEHFKNNDCAWEYRFYNLCARGNPSPEAMKWLFDPKRMPDEVTHYFDGSGWPDAEAGRKVIRTFIASDSEGLEERAEMLEREIDEPGRAGAVGRSLLLEGADASSHQRYERMHDGAFHRAYKALLQEKRLEAEEEEETPAPAPPPRPIDRDAVASVIDIAAAKVAAPNEATPDIPTATGTVVLDGRMIAYDDLDSALTDAIRRAGGLDAVAIDPGSPPIAPPKRP